MNGSIPGRPQNLHAEQIPSQIPCARSAQDRALTGVYRADPVHRSSFMAGEGLHERRRFDGKSVQLQVDSQHPAQAFEEVVPETGIRLSITRRSTPINTGESDSSCFNVDLSADEKRCNHFSVA
jgi:hypothetical protein